MNETVARRIGRMRLGLQSVIPRAPTHEVERIGDEEHDPAFPSADVWRDVRTLYRTGLHPAIALHVRHEGRIVLDRTIGHVWNPPGSAVPGPVVTPQTLFNLFSASKIVLSTLVLALVEDGELDLDARVVDWLPELARHGKERIRLRHLLQHTAGIPDMPRGIDPEAMLAAGRVELEVLADLRPRTAPGTAIAYHPVTSGFVLQEMIERQTGRDLNTLLRARLLDPMGIENLGWGVAPERTAEVARHAVTGPTVPGFVASIFERSIGIDLDRAVALTNRPEFLTAVFPSGNVIGTPAEVGRFVQMLHDGGVCNGVRVLAAKTVSALHHGTTPLQLDGTFGFPMRYGLGVMMGGDAFSLFGLNTAGAFGHLGLSSVVVWADPSRRLSVAFLNTGKPMMAPGMLLWYRVMQSIARRMPRR